MTGTRFSSFSADDKPIDAVVIGASGGIGNAFVELMAADPLFGTVYAFSRSGSSFTHSNVISGLIDIEDEATVEQAALAVGSKGGCQLVVVATGILHNAASKLGPEKDWRQIDPDWLSHVHRINAVGPMLCARHFLPVLPKDKKGVFAAISARVGSISDNGLGGWYGYRASKAALNQYIRTLSVELSRKNKHAICVGLHPGTVDTDLSKPFQGGIAPERLFSAEKSAGHLLSVIDTLSFSDSGQLIAWDGKIIPP